MNAEKPARNWLRLIEISDPDGREWAEAYRRSGFHEKIRSTQDALLLMQAGRTDKATGILSPIAALCAENGEDENLTSILNIVRRYYYAVIAYYHYSSGNLEAAWSSLDRAEQAIRCAVGTHPYLVAVAESCIELTIQRARIAREMRDWKLMWSYLWKARDMAANRVPLCTTLTGQEVYYSTISERLSPLGLTDQEAYAWREVVDIDERQSYVDRLIRGVYTLPGFVIDY
jgi:hypothetical protein